MKQYLLVVLLVWSAACVSSPSAKLPAARPPSRYPLAVVVCEDEPGDGCRNAKKISQATVFIDSQYVGRTNEEGSLTSTVRRGPRVVYVAAVGHAGVRVRVDVSGDAHCEVQLKPTPPPPPHARAEHDHGFDDAR